MRIDSDDNRNAKFIAVADMLQEIGKALLDEIEVFFDVFLLERGAWSDGRSAAVHLQGSDGGDENDSVGHVSRCAALYVEELFHTDVRAEACLGDDDAVGTDELESYSVGDYRRATVRYVCERSRVHEDRGALDALHQIRLYRVFK